MRLQKGICRLFLLLSLAPHFSLAMSACEWAIQTETLSKKFPLPSEELLDLLHQTTDFLSHPAPTDKKTEEKTGLPVKEANEYLIKATDLANTVIDWIAQQATYRVHSGIFHFKISAETRRNMRNNDLFLEMILEQLPFTETVLQTLIKARIWFLTFEGPAPEPIGRIGFDLGLAEAYQPQGLIIDPKTPDYAQIHRALSYLRESFKDKKTDSVEENEPIGFVHFKTSEEFESLKQDFIGFVEPSKESAEPQGHIGFLKPKTVDDTAFVSVLPNYENGLFEIEVSGDSIGF